MQGAEPQQEDRTTVAEQTGKSDTGSGRIIIYDNDSNVRKILKAEQWCKQLLGVTELDYTWCIRLGDTYADVREYDAASEQYKKVRKFLAPRRINCVLIGTTGCRNSPGSRPHRQGAAARRVQNPR